MSRSQACRSTSCNGVKVLSRNGSPFHASNRTQAERRAALLRAEGVDAFVYKHPMSRPFYVGLTEDAAAAHGAKP